MDDKKLYIKENGVRFRNSPDISNSKNIICNLSKGQEVIFVDGPWTKVKIGDQEGWTHGDYITEESSQYTTTPSEQALNFIIGIINTATSLLTIAVRKIINDEFGGGKNGWKLQCTEYVQYRVKIKIGFDIKWPVKSGRDGGKWWKIFQDARLYEILIEPKPNCAMCFTAGISIDPKINDIGHVAFVEAVFSDGSVKVSEANWPRDGIYNERQISKSDWQNKYKAQFVDFS